MIGLLVLAFSAKPLQLAAPEWTYIERYDISAKVPPNTTIEQFQTMLRNLLRDRFKLAVHHEPRELARYELVVSRNGPKFKQSSGNPPPRATDQRDAVDGNGYPVRGPSRPGMAVVDSHARIYYPMETMESLAQILTNQTGRPVIDATGLKGTFEIGMYWITEGASRGGLASQTDDGTSGPTLMQALQEQLGLRLEEKNGPVDFLVVDHAEKMPTEN